MIYPIYSNHPTRVDVRCKGHCGGSWGVTSLRRHTDKPRCSRWDFVLVFDLSLRLRPSSSAAPSPVWTRKNSTGETRRRNVTTQDDEVPTGRDVDLEEIHPGVVGHVVGKTHTYLLGTELKGTSPTGSKTE